MASELVITSVPQGLKPGAYGFCAVACTERMSESVSRALEIVSGYRRVYSAEDGRTNPCAISCYHYKIGGRKTIVLSRGGDAGLDYTSRTNKIAHHVTLDGTEPRDLSCGPAELCAQPGFFRENWDAAEKPRYLPPRVLRRPQSLGVEDVVDGVWKRLTGDSGWAGVLAETVSSRRPVILLTRPDQDVLPLFREAIALLKPEERWNATFSTFYTTAPPDVVCQWKTLIDGAYDAKLLENRAALVLDLRAPGKLPAIDMSRLSGLARTFVSIARGNMKIDRSPRRDRSSNLELDKGDVIIGGSGVFYSGNDTDLAMYSALREAGRGKSKDLNPNALRDVRGKDAPLEPERSCKKVEKRTPGWVWASIVFGVLILLAGAVYLGVWLGRSNVSKDASAGVENAPKTEAAPASDGSGESNADSEVPQAPEPTANEAAKPSETADEKEVEAAPEQENVEQDAAPETNDETEPTDVEDELAEASSDESDGEEEIELNVRPTVREENVDENAPLDSKIGAKARYAHGLLLEIRDVEEKVKELSEFLSACDDLSLADLAKIDELRVKTWKLQEVGKTIQESWRVEKVELGLVDGVLDDVERLYVELFELDEKEREGIVDKANLILKDVGAFGEFLVGVDLSSKAKDDSIKGVKDAVQKIREEVKTYRDLKRQTEETVASVAARAQESAKIKLALEERVARFVVNSIDDGDLSEFEAKTAGGDFYVGGDRTADKLVVWKRFDNDTKELNKRLSVYVDFSFDPDSAWYDCVTLDFGGDPETRLIGDPARILSAPKQTNNKEFKEACFELEAGPEKRPCKLAVRLEKNERKARLVFAVSDPNLTPYILRSAKLQWTIAQKDPDAPSCESARRQLLKVKELPKNGEFAIGDLAKACGGNLNFVDEDELKKLVKRDDLSAFVCLVTGDAVGKNKEDDGASSSFKVKVEEREGGGKDLALEYSWLWPDVSEFRFAMKARRPFWNSGAETTLDLSLDVPWTLKSQEANYLGREGGASDSVENVFAGAYEAYCQTEASPVAANAQDVAAKIEKVWFERYAKGVLLLYIVDPSSAKSEEDRILYAKVLYDASNPKR